MFYPPPEIQKSPIEVQPAVHKDPAWLLLFSFSVVSDSLWSYELQYARLPCPSPFPEACSNSFRWVADAIQPSCPLSRLLLLPSVVPSIRFFFFFFFPSDLTLPIRRPKYWTFSISSSTEYSGLISLRIDWLDLLAVQGTLKSLLQHHSSKRLILRHANIFMVQLFRLYLITWKTIALTLWTFVDKINASVF